MVPPVTPDHEPREPVSAGQFRALGVVIVVLGVAAAATVMRFLAPLIVAAWFAGMTAELRGRLTRRIGGRHRVAALATAALVVIIVAPMVLLAVPLVGNGLQIARAAGRGNLGDVVARLGALGPAPGPRMSAGLVRRLSASGEQMFGGAAALMSSTFSTVSMVVAQLFLLAVCAYYFSAEGTRMLAAMERASPLAPAHLRRLQDEFMAVARAMLAGELLTAAVQGLVAGVIYLALGLPGALVLALVTMVFALVPTVGTALVWVPLSLALGFSGRVRDGVILATLGVTVIATVDNVLRPFFSRFGAGKLHPLLLFLGIFGGIEAFGGWGIILGPLAVALFVAAFGLYADEVAARRARTGADLQRS
jgi:predicted PurR-regulated permease PerM